MSKNKLQLNFKQEKHEDDAYDQSLDKVLDEHNELLKPMKKPSGSTLSLPANVCVNNSLAIGLRYKGGIILAVDSRSTQGSYISSNDDLKVFALNKYMLMSTTGIMADCRHFNRSLKAECDLYEIREEQRITVAATSTILSNTLHTSRSCAFDIGVILAGYDRNGFEMYCVEKNSSRISGNIIVLGTAAPYAAGLLNSEYDWNMKTERLIELAKQAVYYASYRHAYTGGSVRIYRIKKRGWKMVSNIDCHELHYQYEAVKAEQLSKSLGNLQLKGNDEAEMEMNVALQDAELFFTPDAKAEEI